VSDMQSLIHLLQFSSVVTAIINCQTLRVTIDHVITELHDNQRLRNLSHNKVIRLIHRLSSFLLLKYSIISSCLQILSFLPRDAAMLARIGCRRNSIRPSVTRVLCDKTKEHRLLQIF